MLKPIKTKTARADNGSFRIIVGVAGENEL